MNVIEVHKKVFKVSLIIAIIYWLLLIFSYFAHHQAVMCMTCPMPLEPCPDWPGWFSSPCACCVYASDFFYGMFIHLLWVIIPPVLIHFFITSLVYMFLKKK